MASLVASGLITIAGATISTGIQAGDYIVAYVYRNGSNTQPAKPAEFTDIAQGNGSNSISGRVAYAVAAGTSFTYGAWTAGSNGVYHVYRPGAGETLAFGITGVSTAANGNISYGGVTLNVATGTSWVLGFGAIRAVDAAMNTPPTGMTFRQQAPASPGTSQSAGHDTNGGVASWTTQTVAQAGAVAWMTRVIEMTVTASTVSGSLTGTEGADAAAFTGDVFVSGATTGTEGADIAAFAGDVVVAGSLAATEGADTAALSGTVTDGAVAPPVEAPPSVRMYSGGGAYHRISDKDVADLVRLLDPPKRKKRRRKQPTAATFEAAAMALLNADIASVAPSPAVKAVLVDYGAQLQALKAQQAASASLQAMVELMLQKAAEAAADEDDEDILLLIAA